MIALCLIVLFLQQSYSFASELKLSVDNQVTDECLIQYKKCTTDILNFVDSFFSEYEQNYEICIDKINTIKDAEYRYVNCQDQLSMCKGESELTSDRIYESDDIFFETGSPDKHGLSDKALNNIKKEASSIPNLKSLLIARDSKLLFEEYYSHKSSSKPHHIWSVTKSIMALLTGIAIDNGYIESEDVTIYQYFPEYFSGEYDPRKKDITVEHLLTMTTGINFTDNNNWYDWSSYEPYVRDDNAYDWILNYDMLLDFQPGEVWLYGSPNTDLLSSIISKSTGMTTLNFAEKYLFEPLEINNYFWVHDSSENYVGGYMLYLRPRALMRIAQMISNDGVYKDQQIVSKNWLDKSLSSHVELGGEEGFAYGYLWWRFRVSNYQVISAFGYGGQLITFVPELKLIIVTTSDSNSSCSKDSVEEQFNRVLELAKSVILSVSAP